MIAPQVEIGRSSEISNMFWEGKRAVQDYAKVANTWMNIEPEPVLPFHLWRGFRQDSDGSVQMQAVHLLDVSFALGYGER